MEHEWLKAAAEDLLLIEEIIHNPHLTAPAAFHAQQAIEKSLKGYLEHLKIPSKKTHKLQTLLDLCGIRLDEEEDELIQLLDKLYIDARYPGEFGLLPQGKPTTQEVATFYRLARRLHRLVKERIS